MDRRKTKVDLNPILLKIIADDGPVYGLEIAREVRARTDGELELGPGSLYPALHRLEKQGWVEVESRVSPTGSGQVSYYTITDQGRGALEVEARETIRFLDKIKAVFKYGLF